MQQQRTDDQQTLCQFCGTALPPRTWFCTNCGAPAIAPPQVTTGPRLPVLPGYSVTEVLGVGGSAVVYRARQLNLDREVAVKLIRHEVDDGSAWRRFEREAKIIASLTGHPHVVTIYDVGRTPEGQPFLVTELLDKGSLSDVIEAGGALQPSAAIDVGRAMASALTAAHARGILHRDLKPANVLLNSLGQIKLADFGIARLTAGHGHTTTGTLAFTPEHAAPEVLRGETEGTATDVYGLASTVATALAGHSLFTLRPDERIESLMYRKLMEPPPALPATVPRALADLLRQCLDTDPGARPPLSAVVAELDELAAPLAAPSAVRGNSARAAAPTAPATRPLAAARPVAAPPVTASHPEREDSTAFAATQDSGDERPSRDGWWLAAIVIALALIVVAVATTRGGGDVEVADPTATGGAPVVSTADADASVPSVDATVASTASPATAPPLTEPPRTELPSTQPPATNPPATSPPATSPPATSPPATSPPATSPPATAPPTNPPATTPVAPAPAVGNVAIGEDEAISFVESYYAQVRAGDLEQTWSRLTMQFREARNLTFERYAGYWRNTTIDIGDLRYTPGPGQSEARVRFDARYDTGGQVVDEVDEITLRRDSNGEIVITAQDRVG